MNSPGSADPRPALQPNAIAPGRSAAMLLLMTAMLLCVVHLLTLNVDASSPLRAANDPTWPMRLTAQRLNQADALFRRASAGQNLQLVIDPRGVTTAGAADVLTQLYFRSVFAVFPRRVFVGRDDQVINGWEQLTRVSASPDVPWLRAHGVANVLALSLSDDGGLVARLQSVR